MIKGRKYTLLDMQKLAISRGGLCISKEYNHRLKWKCCDNHIWEASINNILYRNSWCPYCNKGYTKEHICKKIFEIIFNKEFLKKYPKFLKGLELDGYNEELGIAFEYNGEQHYKKIPYFHNTDTLEGISNKDNLKVKLCKENNVKLIIIPYWIKIENFKEYIINECEKLNIDIPFKDKHIKYTELDIYSHTYLQKVQNIIKKENAIILTKKYLSSRDKIKIKCKNGHIILQKPIEITKDNKLRCEKCQRLKQRKYNIEDIKKLLKKFNGKLLSKKYTVVENKYLWECQNKHRFYAPASNIIYDNHWCPYCAGNKKLMLEDIKKIAKKHNIKFISNEYISNKINYVWECKTGHQWNATYESIKSKILYSKKHNIILKVCPYCSGNRKHNIEDMNILAKKFNGKFLSKNYKNMNTKYLWKCNKGHIFQREPSIIKYWNCWCSLCKEVKI